MLIFKLIYHIAAFIKKLIMKVIYGNKVKIGKRMTFRSGFTLMIDKGANVIIGNDVFFNKDCTVDAVESIKIGDGTIFGEAVKIYDHNHKFRKRNEPIKAQGYSSKEIVIGTHCWIGSNVVILKGAKIGNNVVVGAGTIISFEIPDNTIVKPRMDNFIIEKMEEEN